MELAYYLTALPHMVAAAFMHIHNGERSYYLESDQKASIVMIGLALGRFITILIMGEFASKITKKMLIYTKFGLCAFSLIVAIILTHSNKDHYNAWWFVMALFWGMQDGALEQISRQVGEDLEEKEKAIAKSSYKTLMVISAFVFYLFSIFLYDATPIWLLLFMIIALVLTFTLALKSGEIELKKKNEIGMMVAPQTENKTEIVPVAQSEIKKEDIQPGKSPETDEIKLE